MFRLPCRSTTSRKAQAALKQAYPGMVRVEKASAPKLWNILRNCRFYDPISGLYSTRRHATRRFGPGGPGVSTSSLLAAGLARAHRIMPRIAGYVHASMFINTRGLGSFPDDLCPLGARRVEVAGVPRVAAVYVWGSDEPTVLALHGWGTDSTTMSAVVDVALANGESAICFDAPGHGASPGSHATITEYAHATLEVLQRFPSIHTIVAHSLGIDRRSLSGSKIRRDERAQCASARSSMLAVGRTRSLGLATRPAPGPGRCRSIVN